MAGIIAVGDVAFDRHTALVPPGQSPFQDALELFSTADILFGNMESIMLPSDFPKEFIAKNALCSEDHVANFIADAGFDIMNMASNHVLDCGRAGMEHTRKRLESLGVRVTGVSKRNFSPHVPVFCDLNGLRFAFLGFLEENNCTHAAEGDRISYLSGEKSVELARELSKQCDCLVMSIHADMEFQPAPSLPKVELCRKLADAGARIVLCHHPHCPQGVELHNGSLIAYSLGNFHFRIDSYLKTGLPYTSYAQALSIEIGEKGNILSWKRNHFMIRNLELGRPERTSPEESAQIEGYCRGLDAILADPQELRKHWHSSSLEYFKQYWDIFRKKEADEFLQNDLWRIWNQENFNWLAGIRDWTERKQSEKFRNKPAEEHHRP